MMTPQAALAEIREVFQAAANPAHAAPMAAYMKGRFPFFGIKAPERRAIQREVMAQYKALDLPALLPLPRILYDQPERELHYLAVDWLTRLHRQFVPESLTDIRYFIATHSWWDTVDVLASHALGDWCRKFPELRHAAILAFTESDNLWLQRSAIIHQLQYKGNTDPALLEATMLPHLRSKEFFLQKAIGWALRQYARVDVGWVRDFVANHPLAPLSRREALKHA